MNPKLRIAICILLILAFPLSSAGAAPLAKSGCDPDFVTRQKGVFTVKPTGADDTANIQCAFDAAVAAGKGKTVRLAAGAFYTQQIAVRDFHGHFMGAGVKKTVVMNIPNLAVTPNFWFDAPSGANLWPTLFSFVNGDFAISDLAIHIAGVEPTLGWEFQGAFVRELYGAIFVNGTKADALVYNLLVEGEPMAEAMFGYNLLNGIYYAGFIGETAPFAPISGTFAVYNSTFRVLDIGTPFSNLADATVLISKNTYEDVWAGMEGVDPQGSNILFTNNKVNGTVGVYLHEMFNAGTSGARFLIRNNTLAGGTGIVVDTYFGEGNDCALWRNDTQRTAELGVYLGEGTKGCLVTGNKKTTVLDLGTGNILVGVTKLDPGLMRGFLKYKIAH
ncbi:MAG: hypothetical protein EHM81_08130 [Chloroflexi bacterium]|nr:MAG: hypothetical protein EHM81_08130 [Chloroflexota bacterium]